MKEIFSEHRFQAVLDAMCCVMVADNIISKSERVKLREMMSLIKSPWDDNEIDHRVRDFINRAKSEGFNNVLNQTCQNLDVVKDSRQQQALLRCLDSVIKADGVIADQERKVRKRIRVALQSHNSEKKTDTKAVTLQKPSQAIISKETWNWKNGFGLYLTPMVMNSPKEEQYARAIYDLIVSWGQSGRLPSPSAVTARQYAKNDISSVLFVASNEQEANRCWENGLSQAVNEIFNVDLDYAQPQNIGPWILKMKTELGSPQIF
jgi:uncharacterized tellurite resistance protein B-like protein